MKTINQIVTELKNIKKEEMDERSFYEAVLKTLIDLTDVPGITDEDTERIKQTLFEIGCEMDEERIKRIGIPLRKMTMEEAISSGDLDQGIIFVNQFMYDPECARFAIGYVFEYGEDNSLAKAWLESCEELRKEEFKKKAERQYSELSPYKHIAKNALMSWNGLSEEEATKTVLSQSVDELDSQVWAKGSVDAAIRSIKSHLDLDEEETSALTDMVYEGVNSENSQKLRPTKNYINNCQILERTVIDALFDVHDEWVRGNGKKFLAREKKHQHMPSELIGWDEVKLDLVFAKPIFEALGFQLSEEKLKEEYEKRVIQYFLNNKITKTEDLVKLISKGENFYPALEGQEENLKLIKQPDFVRSIIIPQIEQKGIGKVEDVRKRAVDHVAETVKEGDMNLLTMEELQGVVESLVNRINELESSGQENSKEYLKTRIRLEKSLTTLYLRMQRERKGKTDVE